MPFSAEVSLPVSSFDVGTMSWVRSPSATASAISTARFNGRVMARTSHRPTAALNSSATAMPIMQAVSKVL